jgi:hypothetical protein
MQYDSRKIVLLRYFEGSPKTLSLDNEFWIQVESCYHETHKYLNQALEKMMKEDAEGAGQKSEGT